MGRILNILERILVWWKAYAAARYVTLRLPTKLCVVPTNTRFCVWGCKVYVLIIAQIDAWIGRRRPTPVSYFVE